MLSEPRTRAKPSSERVGRGQSFFEIGTQITLLSRPRPARRDECGLERISSVATASILALAHPGRGAEGGRTPNLGGATAADDAMARTSRTMRRTRGDIRSRDQEDGQAERLGTGDARRRIATTPLVLEALAVPYHAASGTKSSTVPHPLQICVPRIITALASHTIVAVQPQKSRLPHAPSVSPCPRELVVNLAPEAARRASI